tara:strand:+ start:187 stop:927 length:741 start_codon:yes stop_codon:yes gene_type:complete
MPLRATVSWIQATAQDYHIRSQSFDNPFYFDTLTLSDVIGVAFVTSRADNFSFSDITLVNLNKSFADNFGFTENVATATNYFRTHTDSYTVGDVVNSKVSGLGKSETIAISEVSSIALTLHPILDGISVGDVLAGLVSKAHTDSISVGDAIGLESKPIKADAFAISEAHLKSFNKGIPNSVSFSDTPLLSYNYIFADAFVLDDTAQVDKDYVGFKENVFGFNDTISISSTHGRALGGMVLGSKQFN